MPLNIIVVGAGPAGLAAAAFLRARHNVTVLEKNTLDFDANDYGLSITSNAFYLLVQAGLDIERLNAVIMTHLWDRDAQNAEVRLTHFDTRQGYVGVPSILARRSHLLRELYRLATSTDFPGQPATIIEKTKIKRINVTQGKVWLEDEQSMEADLLIGADGINSVVRSAVVSTDKIVEVSPASGRINDLLAFMTQIPVDILSGTPFGYLAQPNEAGGLVNWASMQGMTDKSRLLAYHISPTEVQVVGYAPEREFSDQFDRSRTSIIKDIPSTRVVDEFKAEFSPAILDLFSHRPIDAWRIRDAVSLDTWCRGRAVVIGDAAHAVSPHAGQGCNISIEDSEALAFILRDFDHAADDDDDSMQRALEKFVNLRKERTQSIAWFSRQLGGLLTEEEKAMRPFMGFEEHRATTYMYQGAEHALKNANLEVH